MQPLRQLHHRLLPLFAIVMILLTACTAGAPPASATAQPSAQPDVPVTANPSSQAGPADVSYTLKTSMANGKMVFVGVGGDLDGVVNPDLTVPLGKTVEITLINGDGIQHDVTFPDFNAASDQIAQKDSQTTVTFTPDREGTFSYFCSVPGHRQAGMEGKLIVGAGGAMAEPEAPSISRDPSDLPAPVGTRAPEKVRVDLETIELAGRLADGTSYTYWTFNGQVPGPFVRVRVGDQVEVHLKNDASSMMAHSVDFHAVTGPGGGSTVTQTPPGQETSFTFTALNPGLYVYHCATPSVATHIANGMYGLILVEPEGGLPPVDHEYYVMQGEIYTMGAFGEKGPQEFSQEKLLAETPEYYVFNGAVGSLTDEHPLTAKTGETVRIFFGVGGPNKVSSFHVIGEIFDRVFDQGSLTAAPLTDVQTTLVPAGGSTMVEFKVEVPGRYILVDHALSRAERGLAGYLLVEGPENPDVFNGTPTAGSGH